MGEYERQAELQKELRSQQADLLRKAEEQRLAWRRNYANWNPEDFFAFVEQVDGLQHKKEWWDDFVSRVKADGPSGWNGMGGAAAIDSAGMLRMWAVKEP